jgi:hypothetical protein
VYENNAEIAKGSYSNLLCSRFIHSSGKDSPYITFILEVTHFAPSTIQLYNIFYNLINKIAGRGKSHIHARSVPTCELIAKRGVSQWQSHGFTLDGVWWPTRVCLANQVGRVETAEKPFLEEADAQVKRMRKWF